MRYLPNLMVSIFKAGDLLKAVALEAELLDLSPPVHARLNIAPRA